MSRKSRDLKIEQQELAAGPTRRLRKSIIIAATLVLGVCLTAGALARWNSSATFLASPFPTPTPTPTPLTHSRDYVYTSNGRLLAAEDAGAQSIAPTDLAVWRLSTVSNTGTWYVMSGSGGVQALQSWGLPTDLPAPGDYDGDGKTDFSVYRAGTTGAYYILQSSSGNLQSATFGGSNDIPAPGDYDGDGRTDIALYRGSNSTFYFIGSADNQVSTHAVGSSGDVPAASDYDGDGKFDPCVFRGSAGNFYYLKSGDGYASATQSWGTTGDVPAPGDYDGDGQSDFTIFRSGTWHSLHSTAGYVATVWGLANDTLVAGDYDADGRTDVAVWRNSTGVWYIQKSTVGSYSVTFGIPGDIPVPAPYRR